jgi:hypothetical protein
MEVFAGERDGIVVTKFEPACFLGKLATDEFELV